MLRFVLNNSRLTIEVDYDAIAARMDLDRLAARRFGPLLVANE